MPLGLSKLASTVKSLEAILVSSSSDDILFDSWSHDGNILTNEDAAGYLGLFVRTRIEVLDALGFQRGPLQASIETDGRILLFRHIQDKYHLVFIFNANLPYGLARLQAEKLQAAIAKELIGSSEITRIPETTDRGAPIPPPPDKDVHETIAQKVSQAALEIEAQRSTTLPKHTLDPDVFHFPHSDVDDPAPAPTDDTVRFDHEVVDDAPEPVVNDDVVFAIGNIEPDHFEADAVRAADPAQVAFPSDISSPPNDEGTTMSTRYTIHQEETVLISSEVQGDAQAMQSAQQQQLYRELMAARLRMTSEGGRPDPEPVDTPTERGRHRTSTVKGKDRMANEGGPVSKHPVDTRTEIYDRFRDDIARERMVAEGGHIYSEDDYTRAHYPHETRDIVASVRRASESITQAQEPQTRAHKVIDYVTQNVSNPSTAHARLAIHSHVPLELILAPQNLDADQVLQLEEAARIILGVPVLPV